MGGGGLTWDEALEQRPTPAIGKIQTTTSCPVSVAPTLDAQYGDKMGQNNQHALNGGAVRAMKTYAIYTGHTTANGSNISDEISQTLNRGSAPAIVHLPDGSGGGGIMSVEQDMTGTLRRETHGHEPVIAQAKMQVRRLTPTECERLQGFPDGHTAITYKGKPAPDGARYKALGNSMAVNVMSFIGQRIQMCDEVLKEFNNQKENA